MIKRIFLFLVSFPVFLVGILFFVITKKTFHYGYVAFRFLFVSTHGFINDFTSKIISKFNNPYKIDKSEGVLGTLNTNIVKEIVAGINENGFYKFEQSLNLETVETIYNQVKLTPVSYLKLSTNGFIQSDNKVLFDANSPLSNRYNYSTEETLSVEYLKDLVFDQNLLHIANEYLQTKPIIDNIALWWSLPFKKELEDRAAQKFHFDMDRFKFIKFFFYLTDVTTETGPHCYVKKSHKNLPNQLYNDGRKEDAELLNYYSEEEILEITGKRGSIIAVDTRGLHKGKSLINGERLLFQIQFSNSLFGACYQKETISNLTKQQQDFKTQFKEVYQLL